MTDDNARAQTALVLQGGGALGAYQAGTYNEIYKHAAKRHSADSVFDIVAGTSIGAINASVLVGHYLKNGNSWEGSNETLLNFWEELSVPTFADLYFGTNNIVGRWWDYLHSINPGIADGETARRFWSIFEFSFTTLGVPKMFKPSPEWGSKFFNPFTDFLPWWRYDYEPLRKQLAKYVDFPIKTSLANGQPRLLLTSVDVQDYTAAVVFDSYQKQHPAREEVREGLLDKEPGSNGPWYSRYGTIENPHIVFYDGIGPDQVLASALGKYSLNHPTIEDAITRTNRELWDGGYLSNTPLRELLIAHRRYWREYHKKRNRVSGVGNLIEIPELEVYVVNLHPSAAPDIPRDKDLIDNRENDILFHDRTAFDELVAYLRTDYVDLAWKLLELARSKGLSDDAEKILQLEAKSIARIGGEFRSATYRDIIDGRTHISRIWNIDRRDSSAALYGKTTDFTPASIAQLILDGKRDARISLNRMQILLAIEGLIEDGIISAKDGEDMMARIRHMVTTEELYRRSRAEVAAAYDRLANMVERIIQNQTRRDSILAPAQDIVKFLDEDLHGIKKEDSRLTDTAA